MTEIPAFTPRSGAGRALILLAAGLLAGCGPSEPPATSPGSASSPAPAAAPSGPPAAAPSGTPLLPSGWTPPTHLVAIKAGSFVRLNRTVTVTRDFWLGRHEVTQAEFQAVLGRNPSFHTNQPTHPVEKVTYFDALAYATVLTRQERSAGRLPESLEYRLPTEAEWEYACRAGTTNAFSFGDAASEAEAYAWTSENSGGVSHPVGLKKPNPWGLHDMHGNVWEWCLDWFGDYPAADLTDPAGPTQGKVRIFRGGGWNNEAPFARSSNRFGMAPSSGIHFVGFRIALAPLPAPVPSSNPSPSPPGSPPAPTP